GAPSLGDLADRRDAVIETLNDLLGAEASIEANGTATLRLGGRVLVQAGISAEIAWDEGTANVPMLGGRSLGMEELAGRLGGLLQARDEDLASAIQGLDEFAARLVRDVNTIYQQGTNSSGAAGNAFFVFATGSDDERNAAGTIALNPILAQDPARISTGRTSAAGDNAIALDIAALRSARGGPASLLNAVVVDIGGRAREANDLARGQEIVLDGIRAERESASGVSLDEEGANLLRFQRSYQASAQLISIADDMAATLLAI
ncbi:MAG TPA: flagellar basal body rod C-terminal domain-containing protein, partial [bacterium]|nr:flagellar basal body rod C-terminal domain-containing protein [bacterium]